MYTWVSFKSLFQQQPLVLSKSPVKVMAFTHISQRSRTKWQLLISVHTSRNPMHRYACPSGCQPVEILKAPHLHHQIFLVQYLAHPIFLYFKLIFFPPTHVFFDGKGFSKATLSLCPAETMPVCLWLF